MKAVELIMGYAVNAHITAHMTAIRLIGAIYLLLSDGYVVV